MGRGDSANEILYGDGLPSPARPRREPPKPEPPVKLIDCSDTDFGMFTDDGNLMVAALVHDVLETYNNLVAGWEENPKFIDWIDDGMRDIRESGHTEVYDTVVRENLCDVLVEAGLPKDELVNRL